MTGYFFKIGIITILMEIKIFIEAAGSDGKWDLQNARRSENMGSGFSVRRSPPTFADLRRLPEDSGRRLGNLVKNHWSDDSGG
jgi:hypothetical protein